MTDITDPEKSLDPVAMFREKISERIREDIGALMPDEMLQKIVGDAIKSELYKDVSRNGYSTQPWLSQTIQEVVGHNIKSAVSSQIQDREEEIKAAVAEEISRAVPAMLSEIIMAIMRGNSFALEQMLMNFRR